ncbi:MAG: hypothetical protein H6672_12580 [Anaerolineaceae bacterium]|nr:hypothetical protein [Anaerolineaceae bacterium]
MTNDDKKYAQVALFGSMGGEWREKVVIPVLKELGVSYFHPGGAGTTWTEAMGVQEVEALSQAETVVMVINSLSPAFGSLSEAGWIALGCMRRNQTYLMYIETTYKVNTPKWYNYVPGLKRRLEAIEDYSNRARLLGKEHARRLAKEVPNLTVTDQIEEIATILRQKYSPKTG